MEFFDAVVPVIVPIGVFLSTVVIINVWVK